MADIQVHSSQSADLAHLVLADAGAGTIRVGGVELVLDLDVEVAAVLLVG